VERDEESTPEASESRLRRWRRDRGWRLKDVGDLAGYSESFISLVERGHRRLTPEAKLRIARALGVRIADLFEPEKS
jgi:transcriptional regulator with XRE-family HTH domain